MDLAAQLGRAQHRPEDHEGVDGDGQQECRRGEPPRPLGEA